MFEQVGKAALLIGLVERSRVDPDADRDLVGRHAVLAGGIAQAIVEHTEAPLAIDRDIATLVQPRGFVGRLERGGGRLRLVGRLGQRGGGLPRRFVLRMRGLAQPGVLLWGGLRLFGLRCARRHIGRVLHSRARACRRQKGKKQGEAAEAGGNGVHVRAYREERREGLMNKMAGPRQKLPIGQ